MNAYTLLTALGGLCVVVSFFSGMRTMVRNGDVGGRRSAAWMAWRVVVQGAVFLTILSAPLSH